MPSRSACRYTNGPITVGAAYTNYQEQGAVTLTKISQRYEDMLDIGGSWNAAPGLWIKPQFIWEQLHQGGYNWVLGANGPLKNTVDAGAIALEVVTRF